MRNLSLITPIIVAIIAVVGTLTPVIIDKISLYNQNKPFIYFDVSYLPEWIFLDVKNNGGAPATNMTLLIYSYPYTISNLTNIKTTGDLMFNNRSVEIRELIDVNNSSIKLQLPKFVQGEGSIISLAISLKDYKLTKDHDHHLDLDSINDIVNIRAIYDQGSSELRNTRINMFGVNILESYLGLPIIVWVVYIIIYPIILVYYRNYLKARQRKKYFNQIVNNLFSIRHTLKVNIDTDTIFHFWNEMAVWIVIWGKNKKIEIKNERHRKLLERYRKKIEQHRKKLDVKDYIVLDNFQLLLEKRNNYLDTKFKNGSFSNIKLRELNIKILKSANDVLTNIDWNKYR